MSAFLLLRILAILGAVCSLWYAGLHVYWSIFTSHLAPLASMSGQELRLEYVTLAAFYLPKLGVLAGAVAIFLQTGWALRTFAVSWAIAAVHSLLWYLSGYFVAENTDDVVGLIVHHAVPHIYFALMVLTMRGRDGMAMTSNYAMQRSASIVTPLAGTASSSEGFRAASGAPTARRR